jgi:hypothetical protein
MRETSRAKRDNFLLCSTEKYFLKENAPSFREFCDNWRLSEEEVLKMKIWSEIKDFNKNSFAI